MRDIDLDGPWTAVEGPSLLRTECESCGSRRALVVVESIDGTVVTVIVCGTCDNA